MKSDDRLSPIRAEIIIALEYMGIKLMKYRKMYLVPRMSMKTKLA